MSLHIGDSDNLSNIYLGTDGLQFVYLGEDVIWQNNAGPVISNVSINGVAVGENEDITLLRNTAHTVSHTATDFEGDAPFTVKLFRNDTQVDTTKTIPTDGGSASFTIPATEYGNVGDVGPVDPKDVWKITVEDSQGSDNDYVFNVDELDFTAPTTSLSLNTTSPGSGATFAYSWNVTPSASGQGQNTTATINGNNTTLSGSATGTTACGSSTTITLGGETTGGGITKTANNRSITYSRTATTTSTSSSIISACSAGTPITVCASNLTNCVTTGTQTRRTTTTTRRICDNALISQTTNDTVENCSISSANTAYYGEPTISCDDFAEDSSGTCTVTVPALPSGVSVSAYSWTSTGNITLANAASASPTMTGSAGSGTVSLQMTFSGGENPNTRVSNTESVTVSTAPLRAVACWAQPVGGEIFYNAGSFAAGGIAYGIRFELNKTPASSGISSLQARANLDMRFSPNTIGTFSVVNNSNNLPYQSLFDTISIGSAPQISGSTVNISNTIQAGTIIKHRAFTGNVSAASLPLATYTVTISGLSARLSCGSLSSAVCVGSTISCNTVTYNIASSSTSFGRPNPTNINFS